MITQATLADAAEILALQKLVYQSEAIRYNDYTLPPLTQTLTGIQADFAKMVVLKTVIDGQIVGSARAYELDGTCYIGRLIVHPDFQGRGIGKKLMDELEGRFAEVKRFELFTGHKSEVPLHIYCQRGYVEFKRQEIDTHTLVYLEKWVK
jgi:ribosomal protein S18 acetylase RimI-like enzyme